MTAPRRVALVHHWLVRRRGGEKCLEVLSRLLPGADLYTLVHDERACPAPPEVARVVTSRLQDVPGARRWFRAWLPRFPSYYGALDLSGHDLVVTSDASVAKTVRVPDGVPHVCYCYSPVRYAFDLREVYLRESVPGPLRPLARRVLDRLADADREAAQRVTRFVAISEHVRERIARCYEREADVVYPPADTAWFAPAADAEERARDERLLAEVPGGSAHAPAADGPAAPDDPAARPYLLLGEAVAYKRFDLGVLACRALDRELVVAGRGPHFDRLRRLAGPRTRFVPDPDDDTVRALYRSCRALLFPGEEDFGLVPVEAMACGRPVVAYGVGGAAETVVDGETGILYGDDSEDGLINALRRFETWERSFASSNAVRRAGIFSVQTHEGAMRTILATARDARPAGEHP